MKPTSPIIHNLPLNTGALKPLFSFIPGETITKFNFGAFLGGIGECLPGMETIGVKIQQIA